MQQDQVLKHFADVQEGIKMAYGKMGKGARPARMARGKMAPMKKKTKKKVRGTQSTRRGY